MKTVTVIVTSAFGLEAVLKRELKALGIVDTVVSDGRIEFQSLLSDIPRLNIWLRTADRVLLKLGEFSAIDFDQLFDGVSDIPWEEWIPVNGKITVDGKSVRSVLTSVRSCQSIVKKAVIERLKKRLKVENFPETGSEFTIQVSLLNDTARLTLDTTGEGLNKRGYRMGAGEAPLRENLAAALVLLSFWDNQRLLIDPMCGAGTILIEAAMIARNMAPGLNRSFAAEDWLFLDKKFWDTARDEASRAIRTDGVLRIFGYDIDERRIKDARMNACKAGVEQDIVFAQLDIQDMCLDQPYGVLISNPPYGIKLGSTSDLVFLYTALDRNAKGRPGWSFYVLTADKKFPDFFKRARPDRVRKLFNGRIEVNYYQYYGERPPRDSVKSMF